MLKRREKNEEKHYCISFASVLTNCLKKQHWFVGRLPNHLSYIYLDLPLHCDAEEHDEVHYKYWPENWHIEDFKKCANHGDDNALCRRVPAERSDPGQNDNMMTNAHEESSV